MPLPFHALGNSGTALCLAADFRDFLEWLDKQGLCLTKHRIPILVLHPSQLQFHNWDSRLPKRCYVTSKAKEFWAFSECQAILNKHKIEIFYIVPEEDL